MGDRLRSCSGIQRSSPWAKYLSEAVQAIVHGLVHDLVRLYLRSAVVLNIQPSNGQLFGLCMQVKRLARLLAWAETQTRPVARTLTLVNSQVSVFSCSNFHGWLCNNTRQRNFDALWKFALQ